MEWKSADLEAYERDGFAILRGFAPRDRCDAMLARVRALCADVEAGRDVAPALHLVEPVLKDAAGPPGARTSKLFRVHRQEPLFRAFATDARLVALVRTLLGPDVDCFLSQFIFKNPGALGQPWHQDAFYFPFDRGPQVGAWLAVTEATLDNGPLWVLPGSHCEAVHDVEPDRRPNTHWSYVEIRDHDMHREIPVLMEPGDLLLFHSHLMHRSTDNGSARLRAAMVFHFAQAGTVDQTKQRFGFESPNTDWMPVARGGTLRA